MKEGGVFQTIGNDGLIGGAWNLWTGILGRGLGIVED